MQCSPQNRSLQVDNHFGSIVAHFKCSLMYVVPTDMASNLSSWSITFITWPLVSNKVGCTVRTYDGRFAAFMEFVLKLVGSTFLQGSLIVLDSP